jgi:glycosyltransferase involved in cell wall biosynthesis
MRILHVTDCFMPRMGGIERQVADLTGRQLAAGHDVEILTAVADHPDALSAQASPGGTPRTPLVLRPTGRPGEPGTIQYSKFRSGGRTVRSGDYDVVHVHASSFSPLGYHAAWTAVRAGLPVVVTVHSLWDRAWPIFDASTVLLRWMRLPIVWTAVSSVVALPLSEHLRRGGGYGTVEVLPNAVDDTAWHVDPMPRDPNRVVIASVMRLALRKRPRPLLAMLRAARQQVPPEIEMRAVIIGDGPRQAGLQRYLTRHDMADWVQLAGRATHEQIREVYRAADFFVAPATLESFGIAALEARSAGLPVIAQAVSGVRDFVTHGREGLLAAGDSEMAEAIATLASSPALRAQMTDYNRRHAPRAGWPEVLAQCDALYARAGASDRDEWAERSA